MSGVWLFKGFVLRQGEGKEQRSARQLLGLGKGVSWRPEHALRFLQMLRKGLDPSLCLLPILKSVSWLVCQQTELCSKSKCRALRGKGVEGKGKKERKKKKMTEEKKKKTFRSSNPIKKMEYIHSENDFMTVPHVFSLNIITF